MNKLERHRKKEAVVAQPKGTTQQLSRVTGIGGWGGEEEEEESTD